MLSRPDVLVLGGGGVLGEAWMTGVLAGIEDATGLDLHQCDYFVGTSAGAIVSAQLVAGEQLRRPRDVPARTEHPVADRPPDNSLALAMRHAVQRAGRFAYSAGAPLAQATLTLSRQGGAIARAALLRRLPPASGSLAGLHDSVERSGARFDGRLRVVAVDRRSGRRVVFGSPGSPAASVADAVTASCTVPWLFAPVMIAGREYVDGGVWSPSNLDVAPAGRGAHVLCLNPTAAITGANSLIGVARSLSRSAVALESLVLRRRGAIVASCGPDAASAVAMGADFMDPEPRHRVLAAGYEQGSALATERLPSLTPPR
jgi:NTE family protein